MAGAAASMAGRRGRTATGRREARQGRPRAPLVAGGWGLEQQRGGWGSRGGAGWLGVENKERMDPERERVGRWRRRTRNGWDIP